MEAYFATMSEDVRHERSILFLLALTDPDIFVQKKIYTRRKKFNQKFSIGEITSLKMFKRILLFTIKIIMFLDY